LSFKRTELKFTGHLQLTCANYAAENLLMQYTA